MTCQDARRFLDALVDGELHDVDRSEIEEHSKACASCREELRALAELKQALRAALPAVVAPAQLRTRVRAALRTARAPEAAGWTWQRVTARAVPVAAAAALLIALTASLRSRPVLMEEAVRDHTRDLPVEVTGPDEASVATWFRGKVGFPVRPPQLGDAQLLGARYHRIRDREGAYLVYNYPSTDARGPGARKISVFVYDPQGQPPAAERRRTVGNREVYLEERGAFRSAMFQSGGVGYLVTGDLDEDSLLQLVTPAVQR